MSDSSKFEKILARVDDLIEEIGWCVVNTEHLSTYLSYTIGLCSKGVPELFVSGLEPNAARHLLNHLASKILHGELSIEHGVERADLLEKNKLTFLSLSQEKAAVAELLVMWSNKTATPVTGAFQVAWSTDQGLFPWDDSEILRNQPLLDRPTLH